MAVLISSHKYDTCVLISLHIRSMWETICDAWACWSGWNFGPNSTEYPYSEIQNTPPKWNMPESPSSRVSEYPPPPESKSRSFRIPPPIPENFRFGMTKVYSGIPPPFQKTSDLGWPKFTPEYPPPILENFRFGMTKVYSGIPTPPNENCQRVQVRDFQNTESYYMWRLYPTRITTSFKCMQKVC